MKSGFGAVDRLLRSPIYCFQGSKTVKDDGVLFEFLCFVKKEQKGLGGRTRTLIESLKKVVDKPPTIGYNPIVDNDLYKRKEEMLHERTV